MTNQHPIVPSPEQVDQWFDDAVQLNSTPKYYIATQAAQWGADQELETTLGLMETLNIRGVDYVRNARRSKPPSLKEQALEALDQLKTGALCSNSVTAESTIRRALEALDD